MNMSKYKRWRALLHRVIVKQQSNRKQTHSVCSHEVEKYEKTERVKIQNDYEAASEKWTNKKKTDVLFVFCKRVYISRKFVQDRLKGFLRNKNIIRKDFFEKPPVIMIITRQILAVEGRRLVVIDHWPALICSAVKHSTGFQIYHYSLISELVLHVKLYQRL